MACLICEKYGITESSYRDMIKNGVISTTFPYHEDIYLYYKSCLKKGHSNGDAVNETSAVKNVSRVLVYNIIKEFNY